MTSIIPSHVSGSFSEPKEIYDDQIFPRTRRSKRNAACRYAFFDRTRYAIVNGDRVEFGESDMAYDNTEPGHPDDEVELRIVAGDGTEFPRVESTRDIGTGRFNKYLRTNEVFSVRLVSGLDDIKVGHRFYNGTSLHPLPPGTVTTIRIKNKGPASERIETTIEEPKPPQRERITISFLCEESGEVVFVDRLPVGFNLRTEVVGQSAGALVHLTDDKARKVAAALINQGVSVSSFPDGEDWGPVDIGPYRVVRVKIGEEYGFHILRRDLPQCLQVPGNFTVDQAAQLAHALIDGVSHSIREASKGGA